MALTCDWASLAQQELDQLLARVGMRCALHQSDIIGQREGRPLAVRSGQPEDVDVRVVRRLRQVHLQVAVGDPDLALVDQRRQLAGRGGGTAVVGLELLEVVEGGILAAIGMDDLQHHGRAVAGLARSRVLDLVLELGIEQVVIGFRAVAEAAVEDEALIVVDQRVVEAALVLVAGRDLVGARGGEGLKQAVGRCLHDERGQGDDNVGLGIRFFLLDALDDATRTRLDILHLDAGGLGEGVEFGLVPVRRPVMQAVGAVDCHHVVGESGAGCDCGGDASREQQGFRDCHGLFPCMESGWTAARNLGLACDGAMTVPRYGKQP